MIPLNSGSCVKIKMRKDIRRDARKREPIQRVFPDYDRGDELKFYRSVVKFNVRRTVNR